MFSQVLRPFRPRKSFFVAFKARRSLVHYDIRVACVLKAYRNAGRHLIKSEPPTLLSKHSCTSARATAMFGRKLEALLVSR